MKIIIDPKKCLGCGTCAALATKTFKLNKKGKAEVLTGKIDSPAVIKMAAENCPTGAISFKP
ncbi:MAG: ferredoxin [bacterium]|nr:ferredoxin [bacterium]